MKLLMVKDKGEPWQRLARTLAGVLDARTSDTSGARRLTAELRRLGHPGRPATEATVFEAFEAASARFDAEAAARNKAGAAAARRAVEVAEAKAAGLLRAHTSCSTCGAPIRWGKTAGGATAPFDLDGTLHFRTCPQASQHSRKAPNRAAQTADAKADEAARAGNERQRRSYAKVALAIESHDMRKRLVDAPILFDASSECALPAPTLEAADEDHTNPPA